METYTEYCKSHIIDTIHDYVGSDYYMADFCYEITQYMNANGTCTFSRAKASEYLKEWWSDCGMYWEFEKDNYGTHSYNPFDDPEAYMVCMVVEGCASLLSASSFMREHWDERLTLTDEIADEIAAEVAKMDKITL